MENIREQSTRRTSQHHVITSQRRRDHQRREIICTPLPRHPSGFVVQSSAECSRVFEKVPEGDTGGTISSRPSADATISAVKSSAFLYPDTPQGSLSSYLLNVRECSRSFEKVPEGDKGGTISSRPSADATISAEKSSAFLSPGSPPACRLRVEG